MIPFNLEIIGCTASLRGEGEYGGCDRAFDGINNNSYWIENGIGPLWVIFELAEESPINQIVLVNGNKNYNRLISFKITIKANELWTTLTGLSIREDANAHVGSDGTITLASGIHVIHVNFNLISNAQSIRLDIYETEEEFFYGRTVVLDEIIPRFQQSEFMI